MALTGAPAAPAARRARLAWAVLVWLSAFALYAPVAQTLGERGTVDHADVLFDADCGWYLDGFANGGHTAHGSFGGRSWVHPNVYNLVHPPIAALGSVVGRVAGASAAAGARRQAALMVAPVAGATRTAVLFLALTEVGFAIPAALTAVTLGAVAFSGAFFAVVPESFGLSGAAFAWLLYLAARAFTRGRVSRAAWWTAGTLLAGFTITNLLSFAALAAWVSLRMGASWMTAARRAIAWTAGAAGATAVLFVALTAAYGRFDMVRLRAGQLHEVRPSVVAAAWRFPRALFHTVVPPWPRWALAGVSQGTRIRVVRVTFRDDIAAILADDKRIEFVEPEPAGGGVDLAALIVTCGATLLAMRGYRHARPEARALLAGCAGLLLVQWALHSVFGFELFLYSQHWYAPLMVLLSGAMLAGGLESFLGGGVLLALAVLAAGRSASLLRFLAELGGGLSP